MASLPPNLDCPQESQRTRKKISVPLAFFVGGLVVMIIGLIIPYTIVAGIGFVSMVLAFIVLNYRLFGNYAKCSLRRFTRRFDSRGSQL